MRPVNAQQVPNKCPTSAHYIYPLLKLHIFSKTFSPCRKFEPPSMGKCQSLYNILREQLSELKFLYFAGGQIGLQNILFASYFFLAEIFKYCYTLLWTPNFH